MRKINFIMMASIHHNFFINASINQVYEAISQPDELRQWWTLATDGKPEKGAVYTLDFGPEYMWEAVVERMDPNKLFELRMTKADADWTGTIVGFLLNRKGQYSQVEFYHTGWKEMNEHYKISTYCWAMYLRILKRYLEYGELVPYEQRLEV